MSVVNKSDFIAHKRKDDNVSQPLTTHLSEVGELCAGLAAKIGMADHGELMGLLHDFGKFSQEFQAYIKSATDEFDRDDDEWVDAKALKGKIDHSTAGAQYLWRKLQESQLKTTSGVEDLCAQILCFCIVSHHSGLIDCLTPEGDLRFFDRIKKDGKKTHVQECMQNCKDEFLNKIDKLITPSLVRSFTLTLGGVVDQLQLGKNLAKTDAFKLGVFTRFLFSCLIDADRLNSAEFEYEQRKVQRLEQASYFNWDTAIARIESHLASLEPSQPIDHIRKNISDACKHRAQDKQGIYTLTVPTGGGKTLASLRYAIHHAKQHQLDRIIYIIPYTSIIEQNAKAAREVLHQDGDKYPWVLEHHSNLEPEKQTWHSKLVAENWDAPIVFTTMVQFLEVLFDGGTRSVRRMHQLANTVLIFDEIQTLPLNCVHMFCNALNFLTKSAGTTAVLCTATQPMLHKLKNADDGQLTLAENPEIIDDKYTLFDDLTRVEINNAIKIGGWEYAEIADQAMQYYSKLGSCLVIVNTKKCAKEIYQHCANQLGTDNTYHLSTGLYPAHRKALFDEIRQKLADGEPVLCISTQLIEAGVDVSFKAVIRSLAGLDSIAQAAGRCNRHGELKDAMDNKIKGRVDIVNIKHESLGMLTDIKAGQECTKRILEETASKDLLAPQTMEQYYQYYFLDPKQVDKMVHPYQNDSLLNMLANNTANPSSGWNEQKRLKQLPLLQQSFMSAAKAFKAIDAPTHSVIIEHKEGKTIVADLCRLAKEFEAKEYYQVLKRAQQYSVNVFPNVWEKLNEQGAIQETQPNEGVYFLRETYYSDDFGLSTEVVAAMEPQIC